MDVRLDSNTYLHFPSFMSNVTSWDIEICIGWEYNCAWKGYRRIVNIYVKNKALGVGDGSKVMYECWMIMHYYVLFLFLREDYDMH